MRPAAVFSIPPGESFVHALARGLLTETAGDPLALADMLILLPNRRGVRALRDAFLRLSGGRPLLLPRLRTLGDADEDDLSLSPGESLDLPPAVPSIHRQLLLARIIMKWWQTQGKAIPSPEQAARLATELADLLDQAQVERLDFAALAALVPAEYADHWQITLQFLTILTVAWPAIVAENGFMDPVPRRNQLIEAQADAWENLPPAGPVIAAGSTGSMPATARLLSVVARLPRGRLVLPGLDPCLDAESWGQLDQTHPQYGLATLLKDLGVAPETVPLWPGCAPGPRCWLMSEAMRPATTTDAWRRLAGRAEEATTALRGVTRLDCPGPREEAGAIALMMRETLQTPERTAALVTPDRALARRVAAELRRFDIEIDDSAGRPLDLTPPGTFLLLTAAMVAEDFAPHATLAAGKHPLALGGLAPGAFRARLRKLEKAVLHGPRPAPGLAGLRQALAAAGRPDIHRRHRVGAEDVVRLDRWLAEWQAHAAPFAALMAEPEVPLSDLLRAHVAFAEALAAGEDQSGADGLWRGEAGRVAADFVAELAEAAKALPPLNGAFYPGLLRGLMSGQVVRPAWGGHPRLHIWGPLEARLQHTDLLILGGLNEGTWPPQPGADPWMSRPMRADFGLPLPERRIGLSAHDFAQAFGAPQVVLTRASRVDGTPTVPSRWLLRLDTVLTACGATAPWLGSSWLDWHGALDRPDAVRPTLPPAPRPPVEARPRRLSATAIETWMRDPYAIYARHILGLEALDPIDADPGAADYGDVVHKTLDAFLKRHPRGALPASALDELMALGDATFADLAAAAPGLAAFWWPRFGRIARWFTAFEGERRADIAEVHSELAGKLDIAAPAGPFTVTARADRIDLLRDGTLVLVDYKTGAPPSAREVAAGYAPQLPIEALIAGHGGFAEVGARDVSRMVYWRLRGSDPGGEERSAGDDPARLAAEAMDGLVGLIAAFDRPETPYEARPHPDKAPKYSDYLHLARVKEWSAGNEEGEE